MADNPKGRGVSNSWRLHPITVPELGLGSCPITVSVWLVPRGVRVARGDRVVEIMAGDATVDLSAPATGVLIARRAREEDVVTPHQVIGWIRAARDSLPGGRVDAQGRW